MAISVTNLALSQPLTPDIKRSSSATELNASDAQRELVVSPKSLTIEAADIYQKPRTISVIEHQSDSALPELNKTLNKHLSNDTAPASDNLLGLFSHTADIVSLGQPTFEQTSSKTFFTTRQPNIDPTEFQQLSQARKTEATAQLSIKTKEGDILTFDIEVFNEHGSLELDAGSYASRNISVKFSLDGELSEEEQQAIDVFTKSLNNELEKALKGKSIDLSKIDIFQDGQLESVDLNVKAGNDSSASIKINMANTDTERSINVKNGQQSVSLNVDKISAYRTEDDRNKALADLLKSLRDGFNKATNHLGDSTLLIDATKLIFGHMPEPQNALPNTQQAMLSGLPDFNIAFKNGSQRATTNAQLNVEQKTKMMADDLHVRVEQNYLFELHGNYDKPLPHLKFPDRDKGNYIAVQIDETQKRFSVLETDDNGIIKLANSYKEAEETHSEQEYNEGKLVRDETETKNNAQILDYLNAVLLAEKKDESVFIEDLLKHLPI